MAKISRKSYEGALMEISQDSHIAPPLILPHVGHEHARFWKGIEKLYNMSTPAKWRTLLAGVVMLLCISL